MITKYPFQNVTRKNDKLMTSEHTDAMAQQIMSTSDNMIIHTQTKTQAITSRLQFSCSK